jgi:hypothetical protein
MTLELTRKGPNVRMVDKPVLGSVTWSHLFLDFLKVFMNMHLKISFTRVQISQFLDLRIKSYGKMKILGEVWAGQASDVAN